MTHAHMNTYKSSVFLPITDGTSAYEGLLSRYRFCLTSPTTVPFSDTSCPPRHEVSLKGTVLGREEMGSTEDEIVGWHHQLNGHEIE